MAFPVGQEILAVALRADRRNCLRLSDSDSRAEVHLEEAGHPTEVEMTAKAGCRTGTLGTDLATH